MADEHENDEYKTYADKLYPVTRKVRGEIRTLMVPAHEVRHYEESWKLLPRVSRPSK